MAFPEAQRQHRFDGNPFLVGEYVAHDPKLRFAGLLVEQSHDPFFESANGWWDLVGKKRFIEVWSVRLGGPIIVIGSDSASTQFRDVRRQHCLRNAKRQISGYARWTRAARAP